MTNLDSSSSTALVCESAISGVVVHARGAVVTRRVMVPATTGGETTFIVPEITPEADPGSVRVTLGPGQGRLIGVRAALHLPEVVAERGPTVEGLEVLRAELAALDDRIRYLRGRQKAWSDLIIAPRGRKLLESRGPVERARAALALTELSGERRRAHAKALQELQAEAEKTRRAIEAVELEDAQRSQRERMGDGHRMLCFYVHLADVAGLESFEVSYAVGSARWWPAYTLYLDDQGRRGRLVVEAVVAQACGEDWDAVALALSTAELVQDARLPELPSIRLGRSQSSKSKGYREPPPGLDELFRNYEQFVGRDSMASFGQASAGKPLLTRSEMGAPAAPAPKASASAPAGPPLYDGMVFEEEMEEEMGDPGSFEDDQLSFGVGGGAPLQVKELRDSLSREMKEKSTGRRRAPVEARPEMIEPAEAWLDFDDLVLAGPQEALRGRLQRRPRPYIGGTGQDFHDVTSGASNFSLVDPGTSRGNFHYRFEAEGHVGIPSDGLFHRIRLMEATGEATVSWRTAPRIEAAVYREVALENPTGYPLLAGPVRVFVDGELRAQTKVETMGVAGAIRLGLGVDENITVVRNTRVQEEGAGLLSASLPGSKRAVLHEVDISLRSSLGYPARVEVVERIPVTDEDTVNVELVSQRPKGTVYDQKERGQALRGGRLWTVDLAAGAKKDIAYAYRITLRSRDEIIGGNRRE